MKKDDKRMIYKSLNGDLYDVSSVEELREYLHLPEHHEIVIPSTTEEIQPFFINIGFGQRIPILFYIYLPYKLYLDGDELHPFGFGNGKPVPRRITDIIQFYDFLQQKRQIPHGWNGLNAQIPLYMPYLQDLPKLCENKVNEWVQELDKIWSACKDQKIISTFLHTVCDSYSLFKEDMNINYFLIQHQQYMTSFHYSFGYIPQQECLKNINDILRK